MLSHPAVDEASAVGLPDPRLGQVPAVAVTLVSPVTEQELMEYLTSRLTSYQRPVAIRVVRAAAADALAQGQPRPGPRALFQRRAPGRVRLCTDRSS